MLTWCLGEEPSLLLRLGALSSLPCWVSCYHLLSVLFPVVPSSSNSKVTEVGTVGLVASLWYEQSQSPFGASGSLEHLSLKPVSFLLWD